MLKRAQRFFQKHAKSKRSLARLAGVGLIGLICFAVTSSEFEGGKRKIALAPMPELTAEQLQRKPNVIIVLSESFWDPTLLQTVTFSRDPLPFFHELAKHYTSGWLLSPQFGGVTANVEFEVLTGNSIRFLSTEAVAYEHDVKTNIDSLASVLSARGYTATAISPFHNWFANTRETYRRFGFSRFISMEFFNPNEYEGPYIADWAVAKRIIEESGKTAGPDFIYANTMENHYHYYPNKFKRNTIEVKGDLPSGDAGLLETYAQGISDADRMLESLVHYYSRYPEPTVIVFFGDHLPYLEEDYKVYRDAGYISGEADPDFLFKMHRTPVIVWSNFIRKPRETIEMSPSFLGPYALKTAGLDGTPYTDYLYSLSRRIPIIPPREHYPSLGVKEDDLAEYKSLQEQMLSGALTPQNPKPLTMGYGPPKIAEFEPAQIKAGQEFKTDEGRSALTVKGGPFGIGSKIYAEGKPLPTTWRNEQTLTAVLPNELYAGPGKIELQVKVVDEKEYVLTQSDPVVISVLP